MMLESLLSYELPAGHHQLHKQLFQLCRKGEHQTGKGKTKENGNYLWWSFHQSGNTRNKTVIPDLIWTSMRRRNTCLGKLACDLAHRSKSPVSLVSISLSVSFMPPQKSPLLQNNVRSEHCQPQWMSPRECWNSDCSLAQLPYSGVAENCYRYRWKPHSSFLRKCDTVLNGVWPIKCLNLCTRAVMARHLHWWSMLGWGRGLKNGRQ